MVVGGGEVALRKVTALQTAGAIVEVVSPEFCPELFQNQQLNRRTKEFQEEDLEGAFLVVSATDDSNVNRRVAQAAQRRGLLVNVVDQPELCNFIVPAVVNRGGLLIAISTAGASPSLAKRIRLELEKLFGPEYEPYVAKLAAFRKQVIAQVADPRKRKRIFERAARREIAELARNNDPSKLDAALNEILRSETSL